MTLVEATFICCKCSVEFSKAVVRPGRKADRVCHDCQRETARVKRRRNYNAAYQREYGRAYRERNREYVAALNSEWERGNRERRRDYQVERVYNVSPDRYTALLNSQGGVCAICRKPESRTNRDGVPNRLSIDHDHSCCPRGSSCGACVRGLLCTTCNVSIAPFEEPATLERLVKYLTGNTMTQGD